jgi:plastocyanin
MTFLNPTLHHGSMSVYSRLVLCSACIALFIIACIAAGCSSSQTPVTPSSPQPILGGENTITIKNFAFDPQTLTIKSGTVVTWMNQDGPSHTVVSDSGSPVAFSSDPLSNGTSYKFTFTQPGTYTYHCSIHPSMKGTIIVQS